VRWLGLALLAALGLLQFRLWLSSDGVREVLRLRAEVASQLQLNASLAERNRELAGEVRDLKQGYAALEERARADLGMIAGNETFYQVVPAPARPHAPTAQE
jgi:cell division protein FtsB